MTHLPPPHPHPHPSLFLLCLCFAPPYHSSVFVSLYINSVIVTSGMCINCDLPYLCLPPPPLSLAPPSSHSSLPASSPLHLKTPPSCLLSPPTLTFNPRMASITRTCWCVRVPWEWPPVLLPLWEASRTPLARPRLLFLSLFFSLPLIRLDTGVWSAATKGGWKCPQMCAVLIVMNEYIPRMCQKILWAKLWCEK